MNRSIVAFVVFGAHIAEQDAFMSTPNRRTGVSPTTSDLNANTSPGRLQMSVVAPMDTETEKIDEHVESDNYLFDKFKPSDDVSRGNIRLDHKLRDEKNVNLESIYQERISRRKKRKGAKSRYEKFEDDMSDPITQYMKTMGDHELLSKNDEVLLSSQIQISNKWLKIRDEIQSDQIRCIADEEWAMNINKDLTVSELKRQIQRGKEAKSVLIKSNLRLVISIAKKFTSHGLSIMDLCQEGILGLDRACETFDHGKGFRFSTYATKLVRQDILKAIAEQKSFPVYIQYELHNMQRAERDLREKLERVPTLEELADQLNVTVERVQVLKRSSLRLLSMDDSLGGGKKKGSGAGTGGSRDRSEQQFTIQHTLADPAEKPNDVVAYKMLQEDVSSLISKLSEREGDVIKMRFGLGNGDEKTLEEVAKVLSTSVTTVWKVQARAIKKLRSLASQELKP